MKEDHCLACGRELEGDTTVTAGVHGKMFVLNFLQFREERSKMMNGGNVPVTVYDMDYADLCPECLIHLLEQAAFRLKERGGKT